MTRATVGQTLRLNVTVTQAFKPLAPVLLSGIVTDVPKTENAEDGQVMYRVNDVPVRVVKGDTPFYRDLAKGASGSDVTELQKALITLGLLHAPATGSFDEQTAAAVKKWQADLHQPATGQIHLGELIAAPDLPAALRLGDGVTLGAQVGPPQPALLASSGIPEFRLVVSQQQSLAIPITATVQITYKGHTWPAVIADSAVSADDSSSVVMNLQSPSGGLPCAADCAALPPAASLSLLSTVEIVPQTTGLAVPAAAVHTAVDGTTYVVMQDNTPRTVTVRASANGLVVVDGVKDGETVWALGGAGDDTSGPASSVAAAVEPPK